MPHKTYIEHLYHYVCSKCNKWWSIAEGIDSDFVTCPRCEHKDVVEFKLKDQREKHQRKGMGL